MSSKSTPIAIIGGSYAGLTLANVLHLHSFPYVIFDCKSLPFTHVLGGAGFNVPSFATVAKKLELKVAEHDRSLTRGDVIDALLERVKSNFATSHRVVRIEEKAGLFYLHIASSPPYSSPNDKNNRNVMGPYRSAIGADGVLSKVRTSALRNTYLIGDARWVNDRWYDLGLQRIKRGADMAMIDGLELGEAIAGGERESSVHRREKKFGASEIARRRVMRNVETTLAVLLALIVYNYLGRLSSVK